jgi:hypothetical protein
MNQDKSDSDYDDSSMEEQWCLDCRNRVIEYLKSQNVQTGRVGLWPAWHIAPYVSVWAVESAIQPEKIGWWVICGDLPTDYLSAADITPPQHPRKAVLAFAERWLKMVEAWHNDTTYEGITIPGPHSPDELAPLLESRARIMLEWASQSDLWQDK